MRKSGRILALVSSVSVLASSAAYGGELAYSCEVAHEHHLDDEANLRPFRNPVDVGKTFEVSRLTGEVEGSPLSTRGATTIQVVDEGASEWSFKTVASTTGDEGANLQVLIVEEFSSGEWKPFVAITVYGAVISGMCR
jgi:hypothetical protein